MALRTPVEFSVGGVKPGREGVRLAEPGRVRVEAAVAFAPRVPRAVAYGTQSPPEGPRAVGDTRVLHAPRNRDWVEGGTRKVEIVVNGEVVASKNVPADGKLHELAFEVDVKESCWVALRQFPQLHTNPIDVLVGKRPIRASQRSARWCVEVIELLWKNRHRNITEKERAAARQAYDRAIERFRAIERECRGE